MSSISQLTVNSQFRFNAQVAGDTVSLRILIHFLRSRRPPYQKELQIVLGNYGHSSDVAFLPVLLVKRLQQIFNGKFLNLY